MSKLTGKVDNQIIALAKQKGIVGADVERPVLDRMSGHTGTPGCNCICFRQGICQVEDILEIAESKGEKRIIVVLDGKQTLTTLIYY